MSDYVTVIIRKFNAQSDSGFVFSSWRNSAYYGASPAHPEDAATWFRKKTKRIAEILWEATVRVACLEDATDTIVGYSVCVGKHLEWVYVKPDYRQQGIATLLIPQSVESYPDEMTKIGRAILDKKKNKEN